MRFPLTSLLALTVSLTLAACGEKEESTSGDQPLSPGPEGAGGSAPSATSPSISSPATSSAPTSTPSVPTSTPTPSAPTPTAPTPTETAAPSTPGPEGTPPDPTIPVPTSPGSGGAGGGTGAGGSGGTPEAAGGESSGGSDSSGGAGGADTGPVGGEFTLTSTKLVDGDEIPDDYTCEGKQFGTGPMPDLTWSGAPEGTLSFALTFVDTTLAPTMPNLGYHWALWDIPPSVTQIAEGPITGASPAEPAGSKQYTPLNPVGFLGPCPGGQRDEYAFTLYALDVATLPNPPNNVQQLEALFEEHALGSVVLSGWSDAQSR